MFMNENLTSVSQISVKQPNISCSEEKPIPVWLLVSMLDDGMTKEQIVKQYPSLSSEEIKTAVKYAESTAV